MKQIVIYFAAVALIILIGCDSSKNDVFTKPVEDLKKPTKLNEQFSYIFGTTIGQNLKKDSIFDIDYEYFIMAIRTQLEGKEPILDRREMDSVMQINQVVLQQREEARNARKQMDNEKNKKVAYDFLEKNKKEKGVITTPTGLQYKSLKEGSGSSPMHNDHVLIHVKTSLIDGTIIADSREKDKPLPIQLNNNLLRCWYEAILKMKIGSKWIIYSPPELAFGEQGNERVPGNMVMIYEIELLDFKLEPYPDEQIIPQGFN